MKKAKSKSQIGTMINFHCSQILCINEKYNVDELHELKMYFSFMYSI